MSIIGLVALGLVAAFSAALLMAAVGKTPGSMRASNSGDRDVTVLVAAHDMPAVSKVHSEDLEERTIKAKDMPKGVMQDPINAVGKTLVRPLLAGEPVTSDCFASNNRGMELVSSLPPGKRAVTVELKLSDGLEGLLYPGSVVDVLAFFRFDRDMKKNVADAVSTTLLQGVEVLAIDDSTATTAEEEGDNTKDDGALARRKTRRVTLLVDSRQAEALQLASAQGTVSLAMRNPQDTTQADRDATLLSGGQLASLAEYLGAWVGDEDMQQDEADPVMPMAAPAPAKSNSKTSQWDVTVMRGDQVEVKSFTRDAGEPSLAERLN
jgi:pilus assembly protein CpaB